MFRSEQREEGRRGEGRRGEEREGRSDWRGGVGDGIGWEGRGGQKAVCQILLY